MPAKGVGDKEIHTPKLTPSVMAAFSGCAAYEVNSSCAPNVLLRFPQLQAVSTQMEKPKGPSGSKRPEREFQAAVNELREHINPQGVSPYTGNPWRNHQWVLLTKPRRSAFKVMKLPRPALIVGRWKYSQSFYGKSPCLQQYQQAKLFHSLPICQLAG